MGIKSYMHRFSISELTMINKNFNWQTAVNIATMTTKRDTLPGFLPTLTSTYKREWRGGWSNIFRYKKIVAGLNGLYCFNPIVTVVKQFPGPDAPVYYETVQRPNSFLLQNIYLGYKFTSRQLGSCEIYVSGRNLLQTRHVELEIGETKYYGIGARVDL
jgi:hypothetical protein